MQPALLEEGHHSRELERLTGLSVQENQARRLLGDITSWRAHLERVGGMPVPLAVAAARWLTEVYEPQIDAVPASLADRLEPAELFHELLEHRLVPLRAARRGGQHGGRARRLPRPAPDQTRRARGRRGRGWVTQFDEEGPSPP